MSCCESSDYGFKCTCYRGKSTWERIAEDDGYADYLYDQMKDRQIEEHIRGMEDDEIQGQD